MTILPPKCLDCTHWHGDKGLTCDAFPDGIPEDIIQGAAHDKPREGDNGIQYERGR